MLNIEEYIAKRKREDKLYEFDFKSHSENMARVIKYVMEYFNSYLDMEKYDYEELKTQEIIKKFQKDVEKRFPNTSQYIISYYLKTKKRLDKYLAKAFEDMRDQELFYCKEDFQRVAKFVIEKKLDVEFEKDLYDNLTVMAEEYKKDNKEKPELAEMIDLDNDIVHWVKDVYRKYDVNILNYARDISYHYYEAYVEVGFDSDTVYHINKYNYRYQENPFDIDGIYERNKEREFIKEHKGELEMLIMYSWLKHEVKDMDYWPEYVQLAISNNRVSLAKSRRVLVPVKVNNINYPEEIGAGYKYIETSDGFIKGVSCSRYVLRLCNEKGKEDIWKDKDLLRYVIANLQNSFKEFGAPDLIEFQSPFKSKGYDIEEFLKHYQVFEKGLKKFTNTEIAIVNGCYKSFKSKEYLVSSPEDIIKLRNACRELKLKLKVCLDFADFNKKNILKSNFGNTINALSEMRNFVVGIHIDTISSWSSYRNIYENEKNHEYISIYDYPRVADFVKGLGAILQDSVPRFFYS